MRGSLKHETKHPYDFADEYAPLYYSHASLAVDLSRGITSPGPHLENRARRVLGLYQNVSTT